MPIELSEQEKKNREIVNTIEALLKEYKPDTGECLIVVATCRTEEDSFATFLATAGKNSSVASAYFQILKSDPAQYQALRSAFMQYAEEKNPLIVDALGRGIKRSMNGRKN